MPAASFTPSPSTFVSKPSTTIFTPKSVSRFSYNDSKIGQGRDAVKKVLRDNPELADEIEAKINEALNAKKDEA